MLSFKPKSLKMLLTCLMAVGLMIPATMSASADDAKSNTVVKQPVQVHVVSVDVVNDGAAINIAVDGKAQINAVNQVKGIYTYEIKNANIAKPASKTLAGVTVKATQASGKVVVEVTSKNNVAIKTAMTQKSGNLVLTVAKAEVVKPVAKSTSVNDKAAKEKELKEKQRLANLERRAKQAEKAKAAAEQKARNAQNEAKAYKNEANSLKARYSKSPYKNVTVELVNADLVYVIKYLAEKMNRDVYVAPDVAGAVTVTLRGVNPEGALALVLKMQSADYKYRIVRGNARNERGTIVVGTPEKIDSIAEDILAPKTRSFSGSQANLTKDFYQLTAAPAAQVLEFLKGQYPDVKFDTHPTLNAFYAKGTKSDLASIKKELASLDKVPEAPAAPVREYIPVNYGNVSDVQNLVKTLVPSVQLSSDARLSTLIVEGTPNDIAQVRDVLERLDKHMQQVMLDVKVVDLNEAGTKNIGVTWSDIASGTMGTFATTFAEVVPSLFYDGSYIAGEGTLGSYDVNDDGSVTYTAGDLAGFNIGTFGRSPFALKAALSFMVSNSDGKILASPRVATLSGEEASIHVGDKYPIVFYDPRAGQFQVNYVDIGTKVAMKPEVKSDGYIVTTVQPTVSTLVTLVNNQYPQTAERTVKTKMRIKNGDTVVLGGLVRDEERHSIVKIPLLGDLPIIGAIFRQESDSSQRTEVVLMVTAHIMD